MRKVVYTCLEYQVPLTSIGPVVTAAIQELGGQIIDHLPYPSSISYITYELGIISDLEVGEIIYTNDNITLSWDSTTVDGNHINETRITIPGTSPTSYVLKLNTLPGGQTIDYMYLKSVIALMV